MKTIFGDSRKTKLKNRWIYFFACILSVGIEIVIFSSVCSAESGWEQLAPLPDPVGFAGMIAGSSDGRLIAAGGSQFREKPPWKGGEKSFGDQVFVLSDKNETWEVASVKLPFSVAHSATASDGQFIYSVGGISATGLLASVLKIGWNGGEIQMERLPDFPHPLAYAAAIILDDTLYVTGGADDVELSHPLQQCWSLFLNDPASEWKRLPDWEGEPAFAPAAGTDGHFIYIFGGGNFPLDTNGKKYTKPLNQVVRLDPKTITWKTMRALPQPRLAPTSPVILLPDGRFWLIGGYASVWSGEPENHRGFERLTYYYNPETDTWEAGASFSETSVSEQSNVTPMIAAPTVVWKENVVIIGGEIKPAVRTRAVIAYPLLR